MRCEAPSTAATCARVSVGRAMPPGLVLWRSDSALTRFRLASVQTARPMKCRWRSGSASCGRRCAARHRLMPAARALAVLCDNCFDVRRVPQKSRSVELRMRLQQSVVDAEGIFDELDSDQSGMLDVEELALLAKLAICGRVIFTQPCALSILNHEGNTQGGATMTRRPLARRSGSASAGRRRTCCCTLTGWCGLGYIRLSLFSTAQPLYSRFPIIFSTCFSKVTIGYHPRCGSSCSSAGASRRTPSGTRTRTSRPPASTSATGRNR